MSISKKETKKKTLIFSVSKLINYVDEVLDTISQTITNIENENGIIISDALGNTYLYVKLK